MSRPPETSSPPERRLDAAAASIFARAPTDIPASMWDPAECPEEWLPRLATIFLVPVYSVDWDVADQRRVIAESLEARRKGGTQAGTIAILDAAGALYDYREPGDRPYEVEVDILNAGATTLPTGQIADILQRQKRASVKMTVSQFVSGELVIPVRTGLGSVVVAPQLEGEFE